MKRLLLGLIGAKIQKSLPPVLQEDACAAASMHGHYHLMDLEVLTGRRRPSCPGSPRCRPDSFTGHGPDMHRMQRKFAAAASHSDKTLAASD